MKKIIFLLFLLLSSYLGFSQDFLKVKRLEVENNASFPEDTIKAPRKIGEIRYRPQDSIYYRAISLTAAKKWSVLGSEIFMTNGAEATNIREILRFPDEYSVVARSIGVLATGGLVSNVDSNATQIWWTISLPSQTGHSGKALITDGTNASWQTVSGGGSVSTVTSVGTGNSNGMTISGANINLHKVTLTTPGILTTGLDSINGAKFWNGAHTFYDFDISFKRAVNDNFYRGLRMFDAANVDVGGMLYNASIKAMAIGDFGGVGTDSLLIFSDGKIAFKANTTVISFPDYLSGTGNSIPLISSNGTMTRGITYLTHSEPADFGSITAQSTSNITMTVTGAVVGDHVTVQSTQNPAGIIYTARVSAANTVMVTAYNITANPVDPDPSTISLKLFR